MTAPHIAVLAGGTSAEREVSLGSGRACASALARSCPTRFVEVTAEALPAGLDPRRDVVFSTLHGTFGEDGRMQRLLDAAGVQYAGCDAAGSELTMDKARTKRAVAARGVRVARDLAFAADAVPTVDAVVAQLGEQVVVKPNDEGSSVGLSIVGSRAELVAAGSVQVAAGARDALHAGDVAASVETSVIQAGDAMQQIGAALTESSTATRHIADQMEAVAESAEVDASMARQSASEARQIGRLANKLQALASQFRT